MFKTLKNNTKGKNKMKKIKKPSTAIFYGNYKEMIYNATKFSVLEMIKTGTVFFSDMYFGMEPLLQAVADMGIRAALSFGACDLFNKDKCKIEMDKINCFLNMKNPNSELIQKVLAIHAVYTVSPELIKFNVDLAKEHNMYLHIHACETKKEVDDCLNEHLFPLRLFPCRLLRKVTEAPFLKK